ncbi:uncharacterized protein [Ambystoma mexicanum]|uniref:uncharacterized protein n=1 Tax=Ambystoma mexicanum TaxID=8296 RepID=UPI0037E851E8
MHSLLLTGVALVWAILPTVVMPVRLPDGASRMECRRRNFWIWINKDFLGYNQWQIQALDASQRIYTITEMIAAQCGFTVVRDLDDNLEIRISYFACPTKTLDDVQFNVSINFLVFFATGRISYDLAMACTLPVIWSPREIICEENYIEVSVRRIVPSVFSFQGLQLGAGSWPVVLAQDWYIDFQYRNGTVRTVTATAATQLGYGIRTTNTRLLLRSPHNTPQSQVMLVEGLALEVTLSTMSYKQPWVILIVETTTACSVEPPRFTPTSLVWLTPAVLTPLVFDIPYYQDQGPLMGVDGLLITPETMQRNGYQLAMDAAALSITVPIGAPGGKMKSDVQNNTYGATYSIDLLLERDWRGLSDDETRHSTCKRITTPFQPQPLLFIDYTVPSMKYFNVALGYFYPDVVVTGLAIHGQQLTPAQATDRGFTLATVTHPNGTSVFFLQVPFLDPLVEQTLLTDWIRRYTLYVTYTMTLVSTGKTFTYTDVVHADLKDIVPPIYAGACGKNTLIMDMTSGSMDRYWVPYIRDLPLTAELITSQKYTVTGTGTTFRLEVPAPGVGLVYEAVTLQSFRVRLDFSLKDNQTLQTMSSFSVSCNFPTGRMLVCLPNGTMIATVFGTDTVPNFDAQRTHLRDPSCLPLEANSTMALFYFSSSECSTTKVYDGTHVITDNEIIFRREEVPVGAPSISRDSEHKLTIRCRYATQQTKTIWAKKSVPLHRGLRVERKPAVRRVARHAPNLQLRLAKDGSYNKFYSAEDLALLRLAPQTLYLDVYLLPHGDQQEVVLEDCWATTVPEPDAVTRWDFISLRCPVGKASHRTTIQDRALKNVKQFAVKTDGLHGQVYIHCLVSICDGSQATHEACVQTCDPNDERTEPAALIKEQVTELLSMGPVEIQAAQDVVSSKYSGEKQWLTWPWVMAVGMAVVGVLSVASVFLAIRIFKC